jgi:hypothetical protein
MGGDVADLEAHPACVHYATADPWTEGQQEAQRAALAIPPDALWTRFWTPQPIGSPAFAWHAQPSPNWPAGDESFASVRFSPSLDKTIARYRGYHLEMIRLFDPPAPGDGSPRRLEVRRVRAWREGSEAYAEWVWYAERGRTEDSYDCSIHRLGWKTPEPERRAAWRALSLVRALAPSSGGRPRDSEKDALIEMARWGAEWLRRYPDARVSDVGRAELVQVSAMAPGSLSNRMARKHIQLSKIHRVLRRHPDFADREF